MRCVYGWQGFHWRRFRDLGWRPLGNCDVPDLQLFPECFPSLKAIRFRGGLEPPLLHCMLWAMTWLVRTGIIQNLRTAAPVLVYVSRLFDFFGSDDSGFYMEMNGLSTNGQR
jgi:hypothetical protein